MGNSHTIFIPFVFCIILTSAFNIRNDITNGEENLEKDLFEGDIVMINPQNGIINSNSRWIKNQEGLVIVPYTIQTNAYRKKYEIFEYAEVSFFTKIYFITGSNDINLMRTSMDNIQQVSCIRFVPRSNQNDYFDIVNGSGCSSHIGRVGGRQVVTLAVFGCMGRGTVIHEFLQYVN